MWSLADLQLMAEDRGRTWESPTKRDANEIKEPLILLAAVDRQITPRQCKRKAVFLTARYIRLCESLTEAEAGMRRERGDTRPLGGRFRFTSCPTSRGRCPVYPNRTRVQAEIVVYSC